MPLPVEMLFLGDADAVQRLLDDLGGISRGDMKLVRSACKRGYNTTPEQRRQCVADVLAILDRPNTSAWFKKAATKTMAAMQKAGWLDDADADRQQSSQ